MTERNRKLTRRNMAAVLTSGMALAQAPEMALAQSPATAQDELLQAARKRNAANSAALERENIPMATEPAFQFKA